LIAATSNLPCSNTADLSLIPAFSNANNLSFCFNPALYISWSLCPNVATYASVSTLFAASKFLAASSSCFLRFSAALAAFSKRFLFCSSCFLVSSSCLFFSASFVFCCTSSTDRVASLILAEDITSF
jgi:hypothetical protein